MEKESEGDTMDETDADVAISLTLSEVLSERSCSSLSVCR